MLGEEVELAEAPANVPVAVEVPVIDACEVRSLIVVEVVTSALVDDAVADDVALGFDMGS